MNTKSISACLALAAGFVTCLLSFIQHVDSVVFAKRFIIVCIIFYIIGVAVSVVINMNFKEMEQDEGELEESESEEGGSEDSSLEENSEDEFE